MGGDGAVTVKAGGNGRDEQTAARGSQVERDVVAVRSQLDYPERDGYIAALEALDRLARKAREADVLIAQHELAGGAE